MKSLHPFLLTPLLYNRCLLVKHSDLSQHIPKSRLRIHGSLFIYNAETCIIINWARCSAETFQPNPWHRLCERDLLISQKALVRAPRTPGGLSEMTTLYNAYIAQQYIYQLHMQMLKQTRLGNNCSDNFHKRNMNCFCVNNKMAPKYAQVKYYS